MINRTITLQLGGKEQTLLYGASGYFEYIEEATGMDAFEWLESIDKKREEGKGAVLSVLKDFAVIVYAGLNCYLDSMNEENAPIEKVRKWCKGIQMEVVKEVFSTAFNAYAGEPEAHQGNGEAKVPA